MTGITDMLMRMMNIVERMSTYEELPAAVMAVFAVALVFGVMNCVLGYRLLRFWVMLFGFAAGALTGLFVAQSMGVTDKMVYLGVMVGAGAIVGLISFMVYKVGIFILGAGLGMTISIYILHPTTSFIFFLCLLFGVVIGSLGVKYAKEVIIVCTSLAGGVMAGYALARLGNLAEIPYGIAMGIGFALIGLLIQFATNRGSDEEDEDEEENHSRADDKTDAFNKNKRDAGNNDKSEKYAVGKERTERKNRYDDYDEDDFM